MILAEQPDDEDYDDEVERLEGVDDDLDEDHIPVRKTRKFDEAELIEQGRVNKNALGEELILTRHFKLEKEFGPSYTGGQIVLTKDGTIAFALNNDKISIVEVDTGRVISEIHEENEDILTFELSKNQQILAASNKNYMVRVYKLPQDLTEIQPNSIKCFQVFRTQTSFGLELAFDPSSRFLAVGTSDSQVKVFDIQKGFQTHEFSGTHRGIIVKLAFYPQKESLRLISAAEDMQVKVWDLVLNSEIATMKAQKGRISSFEFSHDYKVLFVGARDGTVALYNMHK